MILICSDEHEPTTDVVCYWLAYLKKKFIRISNKNSITILKIILNNKEIDIHFAIDDKKYYLSEFTSYWYRRSNLNFKMYYGVDFEYNKKDISDKVNLFLKDELKKVCEFFENQLSKISKLNNHYDNNINKLIVLDKAKNLNINIPNTFVTDDINDLNQNNSYITKPIGDLLIEKDGYRYFSTTKRVDMKKKAFQHSLIQNEIDKKFEIRTFFFNRKFFSSVIFSQSNPKTELDFRNYDLDNPNRVVPYKLPVEFEEKLLKLFDEVNLNSGSLDIAYTKNGEYVLFEINPVGQFEQVELPCNYGIFKQIAEYL